MATTSQTSCYVVIFQVGALDRRKAIREELKTFGGYCPLSTYAWAITTSKSAAEIRDALRNHVVRGERLYVFKTGGAGAWRNAISDAHSEWLKKNI